MKKVIVELQQNPMQFVSEICRFALVGCSNVAINLIGYWCLMAFGMHYIPAYGISYMVSIVNAYFMSNRFVFKTEPGQERSTLASMARVFVIYIGTFLVSEVLLTLQIDYLFVNANMAPVINLMVTSPMTFLLNKYWAFGTCKQPLDLAK